MTDASKGLIASVYPWQQPQWQMLADQISDDRLPHAIMLSGPQYIGKFQFAEILAQALLCGEPVAGYACGRCKQCRLLVSHGHPDLLYLQSEDERKPIKVDAVRELGEFLAKTSQQGGWKVAIVSPAENMNINAANALLKNLEEPSENTLLLLVCHDSSRLPATIRSRCRNLSFGVPEKTAVLSWLKQVLPDRDDHDSLVEQSTGKPLWALKLLETGLLEDKLQLEAAIDDVALNTMTPLDAAAVFLNVDDLIAIDWLQGFVMKRIQRDNTVHKMRLFQYLDRLQSAKKVLLGPSNPNRQLLWEELMLDWQLFSTAGRR